MARIQYQKSVFKCRAPLIDVAVESWTEHIAVVYGEEYLTLTKAEALSLVAALTKAIDDFDGMVAADKAATTARRAKGLVAEKEDK